MKLYYDEINAELINARTGLRATECHGFISGYACATHALVADVVYEYLISDMDDGLSLQYFQEIIARLANYVIATLKDDMFIYKPFLPDDETSLTKRAAALAEWSTGFVSGFGAGGANKLGDECDEFMRDLIEISKMETVSEHDEDGESALFELVEYIRIGVQMVYLKNGKQLQQKPEVLH